MPYPVKVMGDKSSTRYKIEPICQPRYGEIALNAASAIQKLGIYDRSHRPIRLAQIHSNAWALSAPSTMNFPKEV